ncbi:hypothetical protein F5Y13DRAFT_207411 [Hypoxylon sp. FL1857]|nr:hypothetical protein F5Y13DRAFT_207411 [Hypoxylon sp. FL1857]
MLVASRDDIYNKFMRKDLEINDIEVEARECDIVAYVESRLLSDDFIKDLRSPQQEDLQREIVVTLTRNAKGLFLLPYWHLKIIADKSSLLDIRESLKELPPEVSEVYGRALKRVSERCNDSKTNPQSGIGILGIALCSRRPPYLEELRHALATRYPRPEFNESGLPSESEILAQTGGFLTIENDRSVAFMHHTIDEYFKRREVYDEYFTYSHLHLARKCLTYVSHTNFTEISEAKYPFLRYAVHTLGYHISECIPSNSIHHTEILRFLRSDIPLVSLQAVASKIMKYPDVESIKSLKDESSTLHLAILWGLESIVKYLIENGTANIEERGFLGMTPLHMAAKCASLLSTKMLIDANADVSSVDSWGRTALDLVLERPWRRTAWTLLSSHFMPSNDMNVVASGFAAPALSIKACIASSSSSSCLCTLMSIPKNLFSKQLDEEAKYARRLGLYAVLMTNEKFQDFPPMFDVIFDAVDIDPGEELWELDHIINNIIEHVVAWEPNITNDDEKVVMMLLDAGIQTKHLNKADTAPHCTWRHCMGE